MTAMVVEVRFRILRVRRNAAVLHNEWIASLRRADVQIRLDRSGQRGQEQGECENGSKFRFHKVEY